MVSAQYKTETETEADIGGHRRRDSQHPLPPLLDYFPKNSSTSLEEKQGCRILFFEIVAAVGGSWLVT
jgi:hypothetical protein